MDQVRCDHNSAMSVRGHTNVKVTDADMRRPRLKHFRPGESVSQCSCVPLIVDVR